MVIVDLNNGKTQIKGSMPIVCCEIEMALRGLRVNLEKNFDKEFTKEMLDTIFNNSLLSEDEAEEKAKETNKELTKENTELLTRMIERSAKCDKANKDWATLAGAVQIIEAELVKEVAKNE